MTKKTLILCDWRVNSIIRMDAHQSTDVISDEEYLFMPLSAIQNNNK